MNMKVLEARRDVGGGYKVDVSGGERIGRVSSEWSLATAKAGRRSIENTSLMGRW
jgi:hypothetical protein